MEEEIGVVYKTPGSRCRVSLLTQPNGEKYIVVANQFNTKNTDGWFTKRLVYIPYGSAAQVAVLIALAVK